MLYIVATPIGNLSDLSFRAVETLKNVEAILCEDTRHSRFLLKHYGIDKPLISLHQHTSEEKILGLLNKYQELAYISDAGTPGISDPGGKVVELAHKLNLPVSPIPGASALITAISVCGMPSDKFTFLGFMPHKGKQKVFNFIRDSIYITAFYENDGNQLEM